MVAQRFMQSNLDATKLADFDLDLLTTGTVQTITMPDRSGTLFEAASNQVTAITNLTATNVQDALAELQGDIDTLTAITGVYKGAAATVAGLPGGNNGDWAILSALDGVNPPGIYVTDGTTYTLGIEIPDLLAASEAQVGVSRFGDATEVAAGTLNNVGVSPANLQAELGDYTLTTDLAAAGGAGGIGIADAGNIITAGTVEGALQELAAATPPAATELVAGIVELATDAETTTGTDNTRAVHPQGLKVELDKKLPTTLANGSIFVGNAGGTAAAVPVSGDVTITNAGVATVVDASLTAAGKVELATAAETLAVTAGDRAVTPLSLSGLILVGAAETYTDTNVTVLRTIDANAMTLQSLGDVVGTLIQDLRTRGIVA